MGYKGSSTPLKIKNLEPYNLTSISDRKNREARFRLKGHSENTTPEPIKSALLSQHIFSIGFHGIDITINLS